MNFHDKVRQAIKISDKNRALKRRLEEDEDDNPRKSLAETDKMDEEFKEEYTPSPLLAEFFTSAASIKLEPGTCFLWYIVKGKSIRDVVPDFEIHHCKFVFQETIKKSASCHEALFGLGKILAHCGNFEDSLGYMKQACRIRPNDSLYKVWSATLSVKVACKSQNDASIIKEMLEAVLEDHPGQLEALWGLMELSFSQFLVVGTDIEHPKFYASRIKEIDEYYGYLAWTEILINERTNITTGVSALKEIARIHPRRPEAYLKLWKYYYYSIYNYEKAEDIAAEAFLRVTDVECNHYHILFCIFYAKSFFKNGKFKNCFELLQHKFVEHPSYPVFMYQYGKLCVKSEMEEFANNGVTVLQECLSICEGDRHGLIYYWLTKAYLLKDKKYEAYNALKNSIKTLPMSENKKRNELLGISNTLEEQYSLVLSTEQAIKPELDEVEFFKLKKSCEAISEFEPEMSCILTSKVLWAEGDQRSAIDILINYIKSSPSALSPYIILLKYLKSSQEIPIYLEFAQEFLKKTKNWNIPTQMWVQSIQIYSEALAMSGLPGKAILLLKCIAKVFFPPSYEEVPYTKLLHKAETTEQMSQAASSIVESPARRYNYSISRLEKIQLQALSELPKGNEERFIPEDLLMSGDKVEPVRQVEIDTELGDEEVEAALTKGNSVDVAGNMPISNFSFSADSTFLYRIARIACKHQVHIDDGLCAINDFSLLLRYSMNFQLREINRLKAEYWKCLLMAEGSETVDAFEVMRELVPELKRRRLTKKAEYLESLLK